MTPNVRPLIYLAVFLTTLSYVYTQQTYEILPNGTLILDPPPPQTNSTLLAFSNPSYLNFLYSSTDGITNGISTGLTPILDAVLEAGNSSCIAADPNAFLEVSTEDPSPLVTWLIGIVILAVFGMLMCVCVLLCCCCVFCSRCFCANCGAERSQNISPKCTLINLCVWSPILIGLLVMSIFGCIFGIISYSSLNAYISNVPTIYDNSLSFINQSLFGITDQLEFTIQTQLNATFEATILQVQGHFDTSFGNRLDGLVVELNSSVGVIEDLKTAANNLQDDLIDTTALINSLNTAAGEITTDLMNLRTQCASVSVDCSSVPDNVDTGLSTSIVPDISSPVNQLNSLDTSDLTNVVDNVTSRVDTQLNTLRDTFDNMDILSSFDIGSTFSQISDTVGQNLTMFMFNNLLSSLGQDPASVIQTYNTVSTIILVVVIIVFVLIIITVLFALVGLVISLFGYNSDARASMRSQVSNVGARLLTISGYLSFFMTWFLVPVLVVIFVLGTILTTLCQPLVDQSILNYVSPCVANLSPQIDAGEFGNISLQINISYIFEACQNGETLLSALQADELANRIINDVSDLINNEVSNLTTQINPDVISNGIIDSYMNAIEMYNTGDYNFDTANSLITDLDTTAVTQSIDNARAPIMALITQIDSSPTPLNALRASAVSLLLRLDNVENNLVPMANIRLGSIMTNLNDLTNGLNEVNATLTNAFETVTQFAANLSSLTNGLIDASVGTLEDNAVSYLAYVRDNIPQCRFLTDFYTAVVDVICLGVLRNFNALWFCLGWALIFMLLSGIFSFIVARYAVRREHESWFQEEDHSGVPAADEFRPDPNFPQPTAPATHGYLDSNFQPPPNYTYQNDNIEMTPTPVLTQMRTAEAPQAW
ncbi:Prominin-1-A-like [Oopsacas minuta]|uniref:Prominin-1-A-like n=1 Tax=Oopsacas minuta TaxID=111878 RepID=A0AAV7K8D0_9METZ|nr:Prominin-1-A-like [Oopsacas minuta]